VDPGPYHYSPPLGGEKPAPISQFNAHFSPPPAGRRGARLFARALVPHKTAVPSRTTPLVPAQRGPVNVVTGSVRSCPSHPLSLFPSLLPNASQVSRPREPPIATAPRPVVGRVEVRERPCPSTAPPAPSPPQPAHRLFRPAIRQRRHRHPPAEPTPHATFPRLRVPTGIVPVLTARSERVARPHVATPPVPDPRCPIHTTRRRPVLCPHARSPPSRPAAPAPRSTSPSGSRHASGIVLRRGASRRFFLRARLGKFPESVRPNHRLVVSRTEHDAARLPIRSQNHCSPASHVPLIVLRPLHPAGFPRLEFCRPPHP